MATQLTITAYYTRKYVNYAILGIIAYIILRIFWGLLVGAWAIIFPPKPPEPDNKFQKLPILAFPQESEPRSELTFQLQTISGDVPRASDTAVVYHMPKGAPNFLALPKTQDFAQNLDLDPNPIQESKNIYRFNDAELPLRSMRYDIVSNNFVLRYLFEQDTAVFLDRNLPLADDAIEEVKNMLSIHKLTQPDLTAGDVRVAFLKLVGAQLVPTTSLSQGDAVRVDMFRRAVGDMKVYTPNPEEGQVAVIFSGSNNGKKRLIQFAYTFWPIGYETKARYAVKSSRQAWEELQNGSGYIARLPNNGKNVVVRTITLGYYDTYEPQTYLQPIFVFEGDGGFLGYVPAVTPPWTD